MPDFYLPQQGNGLPQEGPAQDGYVLTWINADNQWEAEPPGIASIVNVSGDVTGTSANTTLGQRKVFLFMGS